MKFLRPGLLAGLVGLLAGPASAAEKEERPLPWTEQALSFESGLLWQVGRNTPLSYRLVPNQLTWRSRRVFGRELEDGRQLLVRHRFTLLGTWFQQGPESHYLAWNASPSIELWNAKGTWALVGGAGGGFGWLDSQGVPGGQGQDFTLHWFARFGFEHVTKNGLSLTAGVLLNHLSNGGQTDPNPGIDALGFTFGAAWKF